MLKAGDPTERSSHSSKQATVRHAPSQAPHSPNLVLLAALPLLRLVVAPSAASATAALDWARGDRSASATATNKQTTRKKTGKKTETSK
jgi:hypothetical protein